ncbi:MAG: threonylcarbamoyl-AMP synthase [Lachnospiraceae bacterium]|nr:threonylcarbamoyl-AMP synthase [Lachnospiraceae bacterium]MDD7177699.1 L-threonylcarbamoyladenylate synthase [bacterium]MDY5517684.1 L-threonylcarbamoyladenylate synthase [Lachnospiraceae bacterium]
MKTEMIKINPQVIDLKAIARAGEILKKGGLVAFPTETVYGLGGDATNPDASHKIYSAKGRPSDNPLIVHITNMKALEEMVAQVPQTAYLLAERFWPGPLTMIFQKNDRIPYETTGGMDTVAVRMPSDPIARALIDASTGYIAAPSANTSGRPSPTQAEHVAQDLSGKIDMIIDGGPVDIGLESTIVDLTEEVPMILRPGYITLEMMQEVLGEVRVDPGLIAADSDRKPKAPGMKYRHYAPKADLKVVEGKTERVVQTINRLCAELMDQEKRVGIIATEETKALYKQGIVISIGARDDEEAIARHLYGSLRQFDELGVDAIFSESFETAKMGQAIMNRLLKAAGHQVLEV